MKEIVVVSNDPSDARILGDVCRVYFPGSVPEHLPLTETLEVEGLERDDIRIIIEEKTEPCSFRVKLYTEGQCYDGHSRDSGVFIDENQQNKRRRLLRLGLHQALVPYLLERGRLVSPWGILNMVRPTKTVHRLLNRALSPESIINILQTEYDVRLEKAQLLTKIALKQQPILAELKEEKAISIYLSVPFCPTRCHYCSFPSFPLGKWGHLVVNYLDCLAEEIRATAGELKRLGYTVRTIYLGGGTPTVLTAEQLANLLSLLRDNYHLSPEVEITVEAGRPDTIDRLKLETLKANGVNRISINPQTLHDETLQFIGRKHTAEDILTAYTLAREVGFPVINMDLIIGLPGENSHLLAQTIERIVSLRPENITLHALALKRAASFKQEGVRGLPTDAEGAALTVQAQKALENAGYEAYYLYRQKEIVGHGENVGYCLPEKASLYNILMMEEEQTILGLGVGSSSKFIDPQTNYIDSIYNPKDLFLYQERLSQLIQRKVGKIRSFGVSERG
ncbi:MAG: coproporphyrinogen dehydrogenase HemZ [Peptococcia bacterium]